MEGKEKITLRKETLPSGRTVAVGWASTNRLYVQFERPAIGDELDGIVKVHSNQTLTEAGIVVTLIALEEDTAHALLHLIGFAIVAKQDAGSWIIAALEHVKHAYGDYLLTVEQEDADDLKGEDEHTNC